MHRNDRQRGATLVEAVLAVAMVGLTGAATIPHFTALYRAAALQTVASRVGGLLMQCRAHAVFHRTATSLVFERSPSGEWQAFLAEDGDGDGVNSNDLAAGRDRRLGRVLELELGGASLGILADTAVPDPAGDGLLGGDLTDPIRAGSGNIVTFTPLGTASASSIYFTDHHSRMRVLRVLGVTGRSRSMEWRVGWPAWRPARV